MPSTVSPNPRAGSPAPDELDRLLDYDNAVEDFLRDIPVGQNDQNNSAPAEQPAVDDDQEVQVKKKRRPIPKLDENRLLSDQGIPRLRKITKSRLKSRGKGHEFADISRLLNTYQLWLDDLYPRAKFRDALTMVEKVGHSKRMQVMRKAWLDETKPGRTGGSPDPDVEMSGALGDGDGDGDGENAARQGAQPCADDLFREMLRDEPGNQDAAQKSLELDAPDDDELDALLAENGSSTARQAQQPQQKRRGPFEEDDDEPDEDELDVLLAESNHDQASRPIPRPFEAPGRKQDDPDEDELDALLAEQPSASRKASNSLETTSGAQAASGNRDRDDEFAEEEEIMASMGW